MQGKPPRSERRKPKAEVVIPADLDSAIDSDPRAARDWQKAVREQLQKHFARGLAITGFVCNRKTARYLLDPNED
jgi:predicted GNAT superfamily acetyltransferase